MEYKLTYRKSRSRWIALVMVICMMSSAFLGGAASAATSSADIRGTWSERVLLEWMAKDWLTGYPDGTVRPKNEVTRAEFFSLANKSLGYVDEATISFSDVKPGTWAAKQIAIAVNAGYVDGYPDGTMQPDRKVTREEVSVMVAKAFGLQLNSEATSVFTDVVSISNAGKGAVGALVAAGVLKGYPDGSFRPNKVITREEAVVILDGALKQLERKNEAQKFDASGTYGPATGIETVSGDAVVTVSGVTLRNMEIQGDLLLSASIGEGEATLDNVTVKGTVTVNGGGPNSIYLKDTDLNTLIVDKKNGNIRIVVESSTFVKQVNLRSGAILVSDAAKDKGFGVVHLTKEMPAGSKAILLGEFAEANVASSNVEIELTQGAIRKLNVLSGASKNALKLEEDTQIVELSLEEEVKVQGQGVIDRAIVGERAKESKFERVPGKLEGGGAPSPGTGGGGNPSPSPSPGTGGGGNQDTTPPAAPVVTGVQHRQIYAGPVTPNWSDASGTTSTATLIKDGSSKDGYTRNTEIAENGDYILTVTARKNSNGQRASTTIHFTIDSAPPATPTIESVSDGGRYFSALPDWTDVPGTVSEAVLSKDGHEAEPYARGTRIEEVGDYVLTVTVTKTNNGLTAATSIRFEIASDQAILAEIEGVQEGRTYPSTSITWVDAPGMESSATLAKDGGAADPFVSGTAVTEDGDYTLTVTTRNMLSYQTVEQQIHFTINAELPAAAEIKGVEDGGTYASAVVSWVDAPDMVSTATLAKNGGAADPFVSGTEIREDGSYVLTVTTGWNVNSKTVQQRIAFKIDSVPPLPVRIDLTGTEKRGQPGVYWNAKLYWTDLNGTQSAATLQKDGATPVPYEMNSLVNLDGDYVLTVTTTKLSNGLTATATRSFAVDVGPAPPIVSGFAHKGIYFEPVTMSWEPYERTTLRETRMINLTTGAYIYDFPNHTTLASDGSYRFIVGVERDGTSSSYGYRFVIASIKGVSEGGIYRSVRPTWIEPLEFDWASYSEATLSRDGDAAEPYVKGTVIDERGEYVLTVTWHTGLGSEDQASKSVRFTIDDDAPMPVAVTDIEYGGSYISATPEWQDAPGMTSTATLVEGLGDAMPYASGTEIAENGNYVLKVTTRQDSNGREVEQEIPFVIDADPPRPVSIDIGLDRRQLPSGEIVYYSAKAYWTDWAQTFSTAMLSKNGSAPEPYTMGTVIDRDGDYELTVTTTKLSNGLTATATRSFKVDVGAAAPILSGFKDKGIYFEPVTLSWEAFPGTTIVEVSLEDVGAGEVTNDFPSGTTISDDGTYELTVKVQKDTVTGIHKFRFSITGIRGVADGQTYVSAAPDWVEPIGFGSSIALIEPIGSYNRQYTKGTPIVENGEYLLKVTWRGGVDNSPSQTVRFTIDSTPPEPADITIEGDSRSLSGEMVYYTASATWTDQAGMTSTAMLRKGNGEPVPYTQNTLIDQDGDYELTVITTKQSNGLTSTATHTFKVDTGPPASVTVTGVVYGGSYSSVIPAWDNIAGLTITATLSKDGGVLEAYEKGTPIVEPGEYVLTVTAAKGNGQTAVTEIAFTIVGEGPEKPTIVLNGEPNGINYFSVTPTWTEAEGTTSTATLTRTWDGEEPVTIPYESGTPIDEEGEYVLTVTTTKTSNGLTVMTTVNFTVTMQVP